MVSWSPAQTELIVQYRAENAPSRENLTAIPSGSRRYKCYQCHLILRPEHLLEGGLCPSCQESAALVQMCPLDHNRYSHTIVERIEYCPLCGEPICPECGTHDVMQMSRVTGYVQEVKGWNTAKQQELKDRARYNDLPPARVPVAAEAARPVPAASSPVSVLSAQE